MGKSVKSIVWSSVVFTAFVGSAGYVGASALTAPQPEGMEADLIAVPVVKTVKLATKPAHAVVKPAAVAVNQPGA